MGVSDKKIFKISANENTLWTLAAMLNFKSAPKTQIYRNFEDGFRDICFFLSIYYVSLHLLPLENSL
jgi:hypothetical protein